MFDYDLPPGLIAQRPAPDRTAARLLVLDRATGHIRAHTTVAALPEFLRPGDLLVLNNTRVFPARLLGRRHHTGGAVEFLLVRRIDHERWEALVHPGQKLHPGAVVEFPGTSGALWAEIVDQHFHGRRTIRLWSVGDADVDQLVDALGHTPLPPYIHRADVPDDRERYQTVYAKVRGSVAAPTAGLHFTDHLLAALDAMGVGRAEITLHVGYGTFKPVRVDRVEDHVVDPEHFSISPDASAAIRATASEGRRIVAVGTTTTRALETAARTGVGQLESGDGVADLFIMPGHRFEAVGGLLTNFHLPRSSLLILVSAFAGREQVLAAYREAVARGYRFYSYGDAMLIV